jgi:hypothetical protein
MESTVIIANTVIIRIYVRTPNKAETLLIQESSSKDMESISEHVVDSCGTKLHW